MTVGTQNLTEARQTTTFKMASASNLGRIAHALIIVTALRGLGHALKVAFGPTLHNYRVWRMSEKDRELVFWERQITGVGHDSAKTQAQINPARHGELVPDIIKPYLHLIPKAGAVLDVGAGPVSLLSAGCHRGDYTLTATNLLTESYREMLTTYGFDSALEGVKYIACPAEQLSAHLPKNSYDFTWINNALDYTNSPAASFCQLVEVTKPGGHIVVTGHSIEGSNENWRGLHQHDIWLYGGRIMRSGRSGDTQCLNDNLPVEFVAGVQPRNQYGDMVAVYRKVS